jgi:hypothetical protein
MISAKIFLDGAISLVYDKNTNWIGSMFQGLSRKHRTIRFGQGGGWSNGRTARFTPMQSRFESGSPINPNKRGRGVPAPRPLIKNPGIWPPEHDHPVHIARTAWTFQSPAHRQSRNPWIGPVNILSPDQQANVIGALTEGCSIRAIERLTGIHRDTIMRLAVCGKTGKF